MGKKIHPAMNAAVTSYEKILWDTSGAAQERSLSHCPSLRFSSARTICVFCCVSVAFQMNRFVWKFFLIELI
jgi:hypothetical protein